MLVWCNRPGWKRSTSVEDEDEDEDGDGEESGFAVIVEKTVSGFCVTMLVTTCAGGGAYYQKVKHR